MTIRRVSGACMLQDMMRKQRKASSLGQMMTNQHALCSVFADTLNQAREDLEDEIRVAVTNLGNSTCTALNTLTRKIHHIERAIRSNQPREQEVEGDGGGIDFSRPPWWKEPKAGEKTNARQGETVSETASKANMQKGELSLAYLLDVVNHKLKYMNKQKLSGVAVVTTSDVIYMLDDLSTRIKSEIEKIQTAQI